MDRLPVSKTRYLELLNAELIMHRAYLQGMEFLPAPKEQMPGHEFTEGPEEVYLEVREAVAGKYRIG